MIKDVKYHIATEHGYIGTTPFHSQRRAIRRAVLVADNVETREVYVMAVTDYGTHKGESVVVRVK